MDGIMKAASPEIVCLCGSTKFKKEFEAENRRLTLEGKIVLSVGSFPHQEPDFDWSQHPQLEQLHLRKIDIADRVHVINPGAYVGKSTRAEIDYAYDSGKPVTYLCPIAPDIQLPEGGHDTMYDTPTWFLHLPDGRALRLTETSDGFVVQEG